MNELYKEIKTEYLNGKSLRMLSKEYHVGRDNLSNFLKSENITIRKSNITSRKYSCDENYFECIDNEEKAYWLGFLYADGFIESKRGTYSQKFGIMLSYRDRKHLEKFNKCLNSNYVIHLEDLYLESIRCLSLAGTLSCTFRSIILTFFIRLSDPG